MKVIPGAQMNTNSDMLPVCGAIVHIGKFTEHDINAQKCSKMPPLWANRQGGLNWYCKCDGFMLTLVSERS